MTSAAGSTTDRADTLELLGLVAHLQHVSFGRLSDIAREAPELTQQWEMSRLAAGAVRRRDQVLARTSELGGDCAPRVGDYTQLLGDFDHRTQPSNWWERLLHSYVVDGVSDDFCRIAAGQVDDTSRQLLLEVLDDAARAEFSVAALESAGARDEVLVSRLALWGRRVVGEALNVVQQALAGHPGLMRLILRWDEEKTKADDGGGAANESTADASNRLFGELTAEHTRRMSRLGLTA